MFEATSISGKRVAIVATDGFEESELLGPKRSLEQAGVRVDVISPKQGSIRGWSAKDWAGEVPVDVLVEDARSSDYDGLVLPGGVMNPDKLRRHPAVLRLVSDFFKEGKPVGAICHGPWTLIDAGVVRGRRMTSYESLQSDLINAGAEWVDEPVVVDQGLVTSRKPDDLPAFNRKLLEELAEGIHEGQRKSAPSS